MGGGGRGGSLDATNPITPQEASADLTGAVGQAQIGGTWNAPQAQGFNPFGVAPEVASYYNPNAGVQTGIPQGGFAAPGIAQYFAGGGTPPALSYDPGQYDPWLGEVEQATQQGIQQFERQGADYGLQTQLANRDPQAEGSALTEGEIASYEQGIADAVGLESFDSNLTAEEQMTPEQFEAYQNSPGAQQAAGAIYENNLANVDASGGADSGGLWSSIRGHGDDAGSSLATGTQSNVGLQDHAIALGENMPGLIGAGTNLINETFDIAPQDPNQADARNAQEVSIARHTQNWAEQAPDTPIELTEYTGPTIQAPTSDNDNSGLTHDEIIAMHHPAFATTPEQSAAAAGFDMNDPSTWISSTDSRDSNDDDSGGGGGGGDGK